MWTARLAPNPNLWLTSERVGWMGGMILAAAISYGVGEGQHNAEFVAAKIAPVVQHDKEVVQRAKEISAKIPALVAVADCQRARADIATMAATGSGVNSNDIPSCPPTAAVLSPPVVR